jgi:hypothetical protein
MPAHLKKDPAYRSAKKVKPVAVTTAVGCSIPISAHRRGNSHKLFENLKDRPGAPQTRPP